MTFAISANGIKEVNSVGVPAGDPDGTAIGTLKLDDGMGGNTGFAVFSLTLANLDFPLTGHHIHEAPPTTTGGVLIVFNDPEANRVGNSLVFTNTGLSSVLIDDVLANPSAFYYNLHNTAFPAGAVRDQLAVATSSDVKSYAVSKTKEYFQFNAGPAVLATNNAFLFNASVNTPPPTNSILNASVQLPDGSSRVLTNASEDGNDFHQSFFAQSAMEAVFGSGNYTFTITTVHDGTHTNLTVNLSGDAYPNPPHVSNFSALQSLDPSTGFQITWDAFSGGTTNDIIKVRIRRDSDSETVFETPDPAEAGAMNGTNTAVLVPASTLASGERYTAELRFAKIVATNTNYPGATGFAGYSTRTTFEMGPAFQVLYNFGYANDGAFPKAGLIQGSNGNFYGTTYATTSQGGNDLGTIFELTPSGMFRTVVSMTASNARPVSPLFEAGDGYFYGTSSQGGVSNLGTIFRVRVENPGSFATVVSFRGTNGATPLYGSLISRSGSLLGTTTGGGASGFGTAFQLPPPLIISNLVSFSGPTGSTAGQGASAGVILAGNGNLYGTTESGGPSGQGSIFSIAPNRAFTNLLFFSVTNGSTPMGRLLEGADGFFYGTTYYGATSATQNQYGTIFKMTPSGTLTPLHYFDGTDGSNPRGGLIQAADGNLYGTTEYGGTGGWGTIYRITTNGVFSKLHDFDQTDGYQPYGNLLQATDGNIYGTALGGGYWGFGVVFRFSLNTPPTLACPSDVVVSNDIGQCSAAVTFLPSASGNPVPTVNCSPPSGSTFFAFGATTVTCTASNTFGTTNCSFAVTVKDVEPPAVFCTPDKAVECGTNWNFDRPSGFDNCNATGVVVVITGTITNPICGGAFTATRTWRISDSASNSAFCSQTVTVVDTTPPTIVCASNKTVQCGTSWAFDPPTASDTCSGTNVTITIESTVTNSICGGSYTAIRTWRATDACTNSAFCSQTVTVRDSIPPTIVCATNDVLVPATGNIWLAGATNGTTARQLDSAPAQSPVQVTSVAVTGGRVFQFAATGETSFGPTQPFSGPEGNANNDQFGTPGIFCHGPGTCTSEHGISDILAPISSLVGVFLSDALPDLTAAPAKLDFTTATSRDYLSLSPQLRQVFFIGDGLTTNGVRQSVVAPAGATRLFLGTMDGWDFYSNIGSLSVRVITSPTNRVIECGTPWTFEQPSAIDVCDGTNVTIAIVSTTTNALCGGSYSATRTWRATDSCTNSATCSQTVTVVDTTPPSLTCASNKTVECGVSWTFDQPAASDICSGTNVTVAILGTITNQLSGSNYRATRAWKAIDACGNSNICSQTITVLDTMPPQITCSSNIIAECNGPAGTVVTYLAAASDLCDGAPELLCNPASGSLFALGTTTVTCTAKDKNTNTSQCTFTVTVQDTTPPSLTCPSNIIAAEFPHDSGFGPVTYVTPVAIDLCDSNLTVTCLPPSGSNFSLGTTNVVCTTADASGNTNICAFTVRVIPYRLLVVTSTSDIGGGSLRQAIIDANDCPGENMIIFSIPGPGPYTVQVFSPLPPIVSPLIIDGYSQTGVTNAPVIEITDGYGGGDGLVLRAGSSVVQGLILNGFATAIRIEENGGNLIRGNFIGTDATGSVPIGNFGDGIYINSPTNRIGGTTPETANVISANLGHGIHISGPSAFGNNIQGNLIGTASDGTSALGNGLDGIFLEQSAFNNRIGGTQAGAGNTIKFNGRNGVALAGDAGSSNAIRRNIIAFNGSLSIDLGADGVTPNDPNDNDTGPNQLQNFPVLTDAVSANGITTIQGTLNDVPDGTYQLDFYLNDTTNLAGFGDGAILLGSLSFSVQGGGSQDFSFSVPYTASFTQFVAATVTDVGNNTSEFSQARQVHTPPGIDTQPVGVMTSEGTEVMFCADASGTPPITFQWLHNGVVIPGATNRCYTIPTNSVADGGLYTVQVLNGIGSVVTVPASLDLQITNAAPPAADNFADRVQLSGTNGFALGSNLNAINGEPGEPMHDGKRGGKSVWYKWTPDRTGIATIGTSGSTFDTLLGIYTGASVDHLETVAGDDDDGGFFTSGLRFNAIKDTEYQIAIDGARDDLGTNAGQFILNWNQDETQRLLPSIREQPQSQITAPGSNVMFRVVAERVCGQGHLNCPDPSHFPDEELKQIDYLWYFNGVPIDPPETNNVLVLLNVQLNNVGHYSVLVTYAERSLQSTPADLQFSTFGGLVQHALAFDKFLDAQNPEFTLQLGFGPAAFSAVPAGKNRPAAVAGFVSGYTGLQTFNNSGNATQLKETNTCGVLGGASSWTSFIVAETNILGFTTAGTGFDTLLGVYIQTNASTPFKFLGCGINNLSVQANPGFLYMIGCDGVNGATGTIQLGCNALAHVQITSVSRAPNGVVTVQEVGQPGPRFVLEGSTGLRSWAPIVTNTLPDTGVTNVIDSTAPLFPFRFYRVHTVP